MKQQLKRATGLGLGILLIQPIANAHTRAGHESTVAQLFHQLLHALQGPVVSMVLAVAAVGALLFSYNKWGDRP